MGIVLSDGAVVVLGYGAVRAVAVGQVLLADFWCFGWYAAAAVLVGL